MIWDRNDLGDKTATIVLVEGISEKPCQHCGVEDVYARIFVDDNKLAAAALVMKHIVFPIDVDGDYWVIN